MNVMMTLVFMSIHNGMKQFLKKLHIFDQVGVNSECNDDHDFYVHSQWDETMFEEIAHFYQVGIKGECDDDLVLYVFFTMGYFDF